MKDGDRSGDGTTREGPGPENPAPSPGELEVVLEQTSLGQDFLIRDLEVVDGKVYYSGFRDEGPAFLRYDIATQAHVALGGDTLSHGSFAAASNGVFYFGSRTEPAEKAIFGVPTTSAAPEWLSPVPTYATAVAVDAQNVYWIERGELTTNLRVARRGVFASSPEPTASFGPSIRLGSDMFRRIVVEQGVAYSASDAGRLVRFDIELATTMLEDQGPKTDFAVDATNVYWADGAALKSIPRTAAKDTAPSTIATLPANARNVVAGVGPNGVYVVSTPDANEEPCTAIRIDHTSGAQKVLAELPGPERAIFRENALYIVAKQQILRLADP